MARPAERQQSANMGQNSPKTKPQKHLLGEKHMPCEIDTLKTPTSFHCLRRGLASLRFGVSKFACDLRP